MQSTQKRVQNGKFIIKSLCVFMQKRIPLLGVTFKLYSYQAERLREKGVPILEGDKEKVRKTLI